jgi:rsbT co-antagonist protein RsbR
MSLDSKSNLPSLLKKYESDILSIWINEQLANVSIRKDLIQESELRQQCTEFLRLLQEAVQEADLSSLRGAEWKKVRDFLSDISRSRALLGFTPAETANFIFSLRTPLFAQLRQESSSNPQKFAEEVLTINLLLDKLGLYTTEIFQKSREEIIARHQADMLELSTPVVTLWEKVLALPMIGTLDSARTQVVMETLLQRIVETGSEIAIIDITGVPTVDTLVAQHLLKTVTAARLMGAECIISGIRPQIAATIVHLGVDLGNIITKATLRDAFAVALRKIGRTVVINSQSTIAPPTTQSSQTNLPKFASASYSMQGNA